MFPSRVAEIDKSEAKQQGRQSLINELIAKGIFQKTERGVFARVWVRAMFYVLDRDEKEKFIRVVYAYYFDGTDIADSVRIVDSASGNEVGEYAPYPGLKMQ